MHKYLQRNACLAPDHLCFFNLHFTSQHHPFCTLVFPKKSTFQIVNAHLCRTVCLHVRKMFYNIVEHCHVLYNDSIYSDFIQECKLLVHVLKFLFKHDGIHRHIDFHIPQVCIANRLRQCFLIKIARVRPRTEFLHA